MSLEVAPKTSAFDRIIQRAEQIQEVTVALPGLELAFVFRRDRGYEEMERIQKAAFDAAQSVKDGAPHPAWAGVSPRVASRSIHLSRRMVCVAEADWEEAPHLDPKADATIALMAAGEIKKEDGILYERKWRRTDECWDDLQWVKFAQADPHAYDQVYRLLSDQISASAYAPDPSEVLEKKSG